MTGFGDAQTSHGTGSLTAEVRAVNNRYLKVLLRVPDAYAPLEGELERFIRERIARGTVTLTLRVHQQGRPDDYRLNHVAFGAYLEQLRAACRTHGLPVPADVGDLLHLPGVVEEAAPVSADLEAEWPAVRAVASAAIDKLQEFRRREGAAMGDELRQLGRGMRKLVDAVASRAGLIAAEYRARLHDRVRQVLHEHGVAVEAGDLIREVAILADRADIHEELTRLASHLEHFDRFLDEDTSAGRKLDFLSQEMFREVNTIGSKANDVAIAHDVVEMKAAIERIRELLQNVE